MDSLTTYNGKPLATPTVTAAVEHNTVSDGAKATATQTTHKVECGVVGNTGVAGNLGSNAKS